LAVSKAWPSALPLLAAAICWSCIPAMVLCIDSIMVCIVFIMLSIGVSSFSISGMIASSLSI
jgi:hypothetical protein